MTVASPKLAVILHADIVGSTRLVQRDERLAHARIQETFRSLSDAIAAHGGRIHERRGDAVVAEFDRASDAVSAALAFQHANASDRPVPSGEIHPEVRIGIALGEVVIADRTVTGAGVVLAQRIEQLATADGICVSAAIHEAIPRRLPLDFSGMGDVELKGFDEPVRVYSVGLRSGAAVPEPAVPPPVRGVRSLKPWVTVGAAAALLGALFTYTWLFGSRTPPGEMDGPSAPVRAARPSVAVLPLVNKGGDPDEEYLSDGITEDLIDALGRDKSLAVMAYGAVLPFKDPVTDPSEVSRKLGVRYVLEGSLRRSGARIRVSVRLTDGANGIILWSERIDAEMQDLFTLQDALSRRISGTLSSRLTREEQRRAFTQPTANLEAYQLVLKGRAQLRRATRAANRQARRLFEAAAALDPGYAASYAWLARSYYQRATDGWTEFPDADLKRAEQLAGQALALEPELVDAHRTLARVFGIQLEVDRAISHSERALAINPSDSEAHGDRGLILLYAGRLEEAAASFETAFKFNPNLRSDHFFAHGLTYYTLRRHEDAVEILERGAARYSDYPFIPVVLVAAYGQLGREKGARHNVELVRKLLPFFDAGAFGTRFQEPRHHDYLVEGFRKGGLL